MQKIVIKVVKSIVLAFFMLYALNVILKGVNIYIPLNFITILISTILGPCGVISLIVILFLIK